MTDAAPSLDAASDTSADGGVDATRLFLVLGRITRALRRDAPDSSVGHGGLSTVSTLIREGPQRLGALAALEGVAPPSMTRIIGSLEQLGYVRRAPDPDDGRASVVEATEAGRDLAQGRRSEKLTALAHRIQRLDPVALEALGRAMPALEELARD